MKQFKQVLRKINPNLFLRILNVYEYLFFKKFMKIYYKPKIKKSRKIFKKATTNPEWLLWEELEILQKNYPSKQRFIYDEIATEQRGRYRALKLINSIRSDKKKINQFLELGCGRGMVCYALNHFVKETTGIDIIDEFDEKALKSGVKLLKMDASDLKFENESFDFVYSYDSAEHFLDPEKVLQEILRVVRKNGYIYLSFGPLYMSPWGAHAYRTINFPFWQFLFQTKLIMRFIKEKGLKNFPMFTFNKWSIEDFRKLWRKYSDRLKIIKNKELIDARHLDLVNKYTSCFKSKTNNFDDLIISSVEILFKKIK